MPDPLTTSEPEPRGALARSKTITCGFCNSRLTIEGDPLRLSDEAKAYRDGAELLEATRKAEKKLQAQVNELEGMIATLRDEIERLKRPPEAPSDGPAPEPPKRKAGLYF